VERPFLNQKLTFWDRKEQQVCTTRAEAVSYSLS